jgi:hypothetical protein
MKEVLFVLLVIAVVFSIVGLIYWLTEGKIPNAVYNAVKENRKEKFKNQFYETFDMWFSPPARQKEVDSNRHEALAYIKNLEERVAKLEER